MCDKLREQGNVVFGSGAILAACKLYTQAVLCAPAGLALGNRSAALYHLGHHAAAAADIASYKLQLETSNDKVRGRYITAREAIQEGEVVFQEAPFSCVLLPPFYSSHCHHCLAPLAPVCVQRGQGGDLRRLRRGPVLCCLPAAAPPGQEAGRGAVPVCADSWSRPSSRTPPSFLLREKCRGSPPPPHRPARLQRARRHRAAGGRGRERGAGAPRHRHLPGRQPHEPQLRPAHRQQLPRQAADGAGPGTL